MPANYQNGKIYTIRSRSRPDLVYVGSTTQSLAVRFGGHKYANNTSRQILDLGDSYIELYENYACSNREELNRREGEVMRSMECVNSQIAGRTYKEYVRDNRERIATYKRQYNLDHAGHIAARCKQYNLDNRESLAAKDKQYRQNNRESIAAKGKQYHQDNRESHAVYHRQYRKDNRESLAAHNKQYFQNTKNVQACICGTEYNYGHTQMKNRHYRSQKHQNHVFLVLQKLRGE